MPSYVSRSSVERQIYSDTLLRAATLLIMQHSDRLTREIAERLLEGLPGLTFRAHTEIGSELFSLTFKGLSGPVIDAVKECAQKRHWPIGDQNIALAVDMRLRQRDRDEALLRLIARAARDSVGRAVLTYEPNELVSLSKVIRGMRWPEASSEDWGDVTEMGDPEAVITTIRGAVAALRVDPLALIDEVDWALKHMDEVLRNRHAGWGGLIGVLPRVPLDPQWSLVSQCDLSCADLRRALEHPAPPIAWTASKLLLAYQEGK